MSEDIKVLARLEAILTKSFDNKDWDTLVAALRKGKEDTRRLDALEANAQEAELHGGEEDGLTIRAAAISYHPQYTLREAIDLAYPPNDTDIPS